MNLAKSQAQDTKINTQKSLVFLYTNNEKSERDIKESIPTRHCNKKNKISGTNTTQGDKRIVYKKL